MRLTRRTFTCLIGGSVLAGPHVAIAQRAAKVRLIGVLIGGYTSTDSTGQAYLNAFLTALSGLGWIVDRNLRIEARWMGNDIERLKTYVAELVAMAPDVIFCASTPVAVEFARTTRTIPIVFVQVADPISDGLAASLARPAGNITGFSTGYDPAMGGKWLTVLKEIAPRVSRVGYMLLPEMASYIAMAHGAEAVAPSLGARVSMIGVHNPLEIERGITDFAADADGGLIVCPSAVTNSNHELIVELAARYKLPGVYPYRYYVSAGGLASYGVQLTDEYKRGATYVDRILKGEKPGDLPIQLPTSFEFVINLKAARALELTVPPTLLATADEVIQ
jgi:putative tryptophan/tyrosine transport system substrate-binding protein